MPPKTRRAVNGPTSAGQSTLSFKNRISKPSDATSNAKRNISKSNKLNAPAEEIITTEIARQTTPESEIVSSKSGKGATAAPKAAPAADLSPVRIIPSPSRQKSKKRARRSLNDEDEDISYDAVEKQASKISDAQIKKYWKVEEDSRLAPRVHQEKVHTYEKILRHFDLSSQYGPCIGITRLARWKRAQALSLNPPVEVLAVLLKEEGEGKKRNTGRIAYVDELGGAREVEV